MIDCSPEGKISSFKQFAELNAVFWKGKKNEKKTGNILVFPGSLFAQHIIECMLTAKKLSVKKACEIDVLFFGHAPGIEDVYHSYNINRIIKFNHANFFQKCKYALKAIRFWASLRDVYDLLKYSYKGLRVGELMYDYIMRDQPNIYRLNEREISYIRYFAIFYLYIDIFGKLLSTNRYDTVVIADVDYQRGMLPLLAALHNMDIYQVHAGNVYKRCEILRLGKKYDYVTITKDMYDHYSRRMSEKQKEEILNNHFKGALPSFDAAFNNKTNYTKQELFSKMGLILDEKKIVLVAAHAFSDSPHYGMNMIYRDYYTWLLETLRILSRNTDVHVLVKEHPTAKFYHEENSVMRMITENNMRNVHIVPSDINPYSLFQIVDAIVTCQGTIGIEGTIFGLPVFTAGQGYYYGFGIDINSTTKTEYEKNLSNIVQYGERENTVKDIAKNLLCIFTVHNKMGMVPEVIPQDHFVDNIEHLTSPEYQFSYVNTMIEKGMPVRGAFYSTILEERFFVFE